MDITGFQIESPIQVRFDRGFSTHMHKAAKLDRILAFFRFNIYPASRADLGFDFTNEWLGDLTFDCNALK